MITENKANNRLKTAGSDRRAKKRRLLEVVLVLEMFYKGFTVAVQFEFVN